MVGRAVARRCIVVHGASSAKVMGLMIGEHITCRETNKTLFVNATVFTFFGEINPQMIKKNPNVKTQTLYL